jgi:hypothetical protein
LGNNFIAATAAHPVITRAVELAAAAMNRDDKDLVWLSTGPGLFTRAFAQVWAESKPGSFFAPDPGARSGSDPARHRNPLSGALQIDGLALEPFFFWQGQTGKPETRLRRY